MGARMHRWVSWLVVGLVSCSGRSEEPPESAEPPVGPDGCGPGQIEHGAGQCCPAGTTPELDGDCAPAGIPAEECGTGFEPDGQQGCTPVLPAEPCPSGLMAVPGDTACREVAPCGEGTWGDIPLEAGAIFVDGSYVGGDSDGSMQRPWPTITAAVDHAAPGAMVAIAAGSYAEDVGVFGQAVRLWGRCPSLVEVVGTGDASAAVQFGVGADQSELRQLAITGPRRGVRLAGARGVRLDRVWIHDTGLTAVHANASVGPTAMLLADSLVEEAVQFGAFLDGAELAMDRSEMRAVAPHPQGDPGGCVVMLATADPAVRPLLTIGASVIHDCAEVGVLVFGTDVSVEGSVVRDTTDPEGWTIGLQTHPLSAARAAAGLYQSLIAGGHQSGVSVHGSDLELEATVVRDTQPGPEGAGGVGITAVIDDATGERASVALDRSILVNNRRFALALFGADGVVDRTVVRDTPADASGGQGAGILVQKDLDHLVRAVAILRGSVVERSQTAAIIVMAADAVVDGSALRDTSPNPLGEFGMGVQVQGHGPEEGGRAQLQLTRSILARHHGSGVVVIRGDARIEQSLVEATLAQPGTGFGDGITVVGSSVHPAGVQLLDSIIRDNARAGVASFGATVALRNVELECNLVHLNGEQDFRVLGLPVSHPFVFDDQGGNICGCAGETSTCAVLSSGLEAPPALDPLAP